MSPERKGAKRSMNSAKRAGAKFEIDQADHYRRTLGDLGIDRQPKNGTKDLGDIAGVYLGERPVVIECKNTSSINLTAAMRESHQEALNLAEYRLVKYDQEVDPIPVVVHKRHGVAAPGKQWVTMEVDTFLEIIEEAVK